MSKNICREVETKIVSSFIENPRSLQAALDLLCLMETGYSPKILVYKNRFSAFSLASHIVRLLVHEGHLLNSTITNHPLCSLFDPSMEILDIKTYRDAPSERSKLRLYFNGKSATLLCGRGEENTVVSKVLTCRFDMEDEELRFYFKLGVRLGEQHYTKFRISPIYAMLFDKSAACGHRKCHIGASPVFTLGFSLVPIGGEVVNLTYEKAIFIDSIHKAAKDIIASVLRTNLGPIQPQLQRSPCEIPHSIVTTVKYPYYAVDGLDILKYVKLGNDIVFGDIFDKCLDHLIEKTNFL